MKKNFFSIALVAMVMVTFGCNRSESNQNVAEAKDAKCAEKGHCDHKHQCPNPFEGIELTPEQQEALKALQTPCPESKQCKEGKDCPEGKECAEGKQCPEGKECASKGKEAKAEFLGKVKAILTPEQYTQFLENIALNAAPGHGHKGAGKHECKHDGNHEKCEGNHEKCEGGKCPHESANK